MSTSQLLTISEMYGFCNLIAVCWALVWSLRRLAFSLLNQTHGGRWVDFWFAMGRGFALSFRPDYGRRGALALVTWHGGGGRRAGPADRPPWQCAPDFVFCSCHCGVPLRVEQAAARYDVAGTAMDLIILKRPHRVVVQS